VQRFAQPLRLRSAGAADAARKVTWLELFFNLIFVAAVSQVAAPLREDYTLTGLMRFAPLVVLIWWAWRPQAVP
jgi:low temperature requirement protein LtrA